MAEVLALPLLFDAVVAAFAAEEAAAALPGPPPSPPLTSIVFGWKEVTAQINQGPAGANRIVFAPGDTGNKFANDLPPHGIGREPRPLATEQEFFVCWIWGCDGSAPHDERKQYTAARMLFDTWRRIIYNATHTDGDNGIGPVAIHSLEWNRKRVERAFGAEIIAVCSVHAMVPDSGLAIVDPPITGHLTVTELSKSTTLDVVSTP